MNKPAQSDASWPPIIVSMKVPAWVRVRDSVLAVVGWLIVQDLILDFWILMYDWLKDPIFELAPADAPDWDAIASRLAPFVIFSAILVAGIVLTALQRKRLIARSLESASSSTRTADTAGEMLLLADTSSVDLQSVRSADVHIDHQGAIERVTPRSGIERRSSSALAAP